MRRLRLHHYILIAMAAGAATGLALNWGVQGGMLEPASAESVGSMAKEVGGLFLRLLKMVVVPLIVTSLVSGVTSMGSLQQIGRLGGRTFAYYITTSLLAITTGITVVNVIRPGERADIALLQRLAGDSHGMPEAIAGQEQSVGAILWQQVVAMVPANPLASAAQGDMLPIIFFSLLLGVFINVTGGEAGEFLRRAFNAGFEVMMRMTMFVIALAPVGVFAFMLAATATEGTEPFIALGWYMLTVFIALCIHACLVLPALLRTLSGRSPWRFAGAMSPALMTAFSSASSNATLPLTMRSIEERAGVGQSASAFVLPLGATINMDGTALYEAVAVLFIAQAMGADLTLGQQMIVALTALLASIGAAGIPHAGLVMMVVVLTAVGLPTEAVAIILPVDRVLDMCRTTVNVWSDCTCTAVIDAYERRTAATAVPP